MPGGFVGVDAFFVISGYLITALIVRENERGTFSFRDFYVRRLLRIFPALALVLLASIIAGRLLLAAPDFTELGWSVAAAVLFAANLDRWAEAESLRPNPADVDPLSHLWSLGIEEQFYALWPLAVLSLLGRRGLLAPACAAVAVASFALGLADVSSHPAAANFSPLSRAWELMCGAGLASAGPRAAGDRAGLARIQSWAGIALVVASLFVIDGSRPYPGWWAMLPVAGTMLLISAGPDAWLNRVVLSARMLVGIGLISYPLYLWHLPLLQFARARADPLSTQGTFLAVLVATALAAVTYRFVEQPARAAHGRERSVLAFCWAATLVAAGLLGFAIAGWRYVRI